MLDLIKLFKNYGPTYGVLLAAGALLYGFKDAIPEDRRFYLLASYIVFAIAVAVALHIYDSRRSDRSSSGGQPDTYFYKPREGQFYNLEYYERFEENIGNAETQIVMSGDGFGCDTDESRKRASEYVAKYRGILEKGIYVLRVQIESRSHAFWAELLGRLVDDFPDTFKLYILKDEYINFIEANMAAIDPDLEQKNSASIMFTTEKYLGVKTQALATFAFIVENDREFSVEIGKRVRNLTEARYSIEVSSSEKVKKILGRPFPGKGEEA